MKLQGKIVHVEGIALKDDYDCNILRFKIEHIPIIHLPWDRRISTLNVELAGIWSTSQGIETVKQKVNNRSIWFRLYASDEVNNLLYSSIHLKRV